MGGIQEVGPRPRAQESHASDFVRRPQLVRSPGNGTARFHLQKYRPVKPPIEVAAGLVFRGGKLLITQRRADSHLGGLWEFPGGKREAAETFEECLARELREELGIEVAVEELVKEITHAYPEKT